MKALPSRVLLAITCCAWLGVACSKDDDGSPQDVNGSGGTVSASGGAQPSVLDRDRLAANCAGLEAEEGASCGEAELVCAAASGALCICGGVPPETGQLQDNDDGNDDNDWRGPRGSGGARSGPGEPEASDLSWVCYAIGPPPQGDGDGDGDGEGGETSQGGQGGAF